MCAVALFKNYLVKNINLISFYIQKFVGLATWFILVTLVDLQPLLMALALELFSPEHAALLTF